MAAVQDNNYTLTHGNLTTSAMYSDILNTYYGGAADGSALRKIPRSTDDNKIVFKQFVDWASANPNLFAQTIDMWQTSVPPYLFGMFPEEVTNKQNIIQTVVNAEVVAPDIMSRKAPTRHVNTSVSRVGASLHFYGIAYTMDYYFNEVDGKGNGDQWLEFDLNLMAVMQSYIATRIHTIFLTFPVTAHLKGGPHREFAYTELPHDVESFLRVRNANFALLSTDHSNGFMEIIRRGNEIFSRDNLVVGGILVADSLLGSAMFDKDVKIEYSKAGGNSFIADKTTNPRILPKNVVVYEVPYVQKLKHNEYDLNPFRHAVMLGSLAYYDDFYAELRSDEYRSVFRNISYYDDVSRRRSEHNFVHGLLHSGHFDANGNMAIGMKLDFLHPEVINTMCDFCSSNRDGVIATNTYDILSRKSSHDDTQLVPCFTFGELPKETYSDHIMERMFEDCCYQLLHRLSIRTDILDNAMFRGALPDVAASEGVPYDTENVNVLGDMTTRATELLINNEIRQFLTELGSVFPWINDNLGIACRYLFLDQSYILTKNVDEEIDNNLIVADLHYANYVDTYNLFKNNPDYSKLAVHSACIGNLRLCPRFEEFYQKSIELRGMSRFSAIVLRALIMTPINSVSLRKFEELDIRLPFGLLDLRPFETQEMKDAIVVAAGQLGKSYVSEGHKFVSFSTNTQQLVINNYASMGALITNTNAFQYFQNIKGGARIGGKGDKYINENPRFDPHTENHDPSTLHEAIADVPLLGRNCIFAAMTSHSDAVNMRKPVHVSVDGKFRPDQFSGYADVFPEFSRKGNRPQFEGVFWLNWFFRLHECQSFKERDVPDPAQLTRNNTCFLESFNKICSQVDSQYYDPDSIDFKNDKESHHAWGKQGDGSYQREMGDF